MNHLIHPLQFSAAPPARFNCPFAYTPHPLCLAAAEEVKREVARHAEWADELAEGKMLGVMVVEGGFLAAFSGTLCGRSTLPYFVPPVFDLHKPDCHFQQEEREISLINRRIAALEQSAELAAARQRLAEAKAEAESAIAAVRQRKKEAASVQESQFLSGELRRTKLRETARVAEAQAEADALLQPIKLLKQERRERSEALQAWLFRQFRFRNARGEEACLTDIFGQRTPPSGAGECCGPKLLQYALVHGLRPLCMAEFWVGRSPRDEVRHEGRFYPACDTKCRPILTWMLQGMDVEPDTSRERHPEPLRVLYSDRSLCVVWKPWGMLSVPGKQEGLPCVKIEVQRLFPQAEGPMMVHRLDMDTSGLMVVALTTKAYHHLQVQFEKHTVEKRYTAELEREIVIGSLRSLKSLKSLESLETLESIETSGLISLPLCPDPTDRPRQMVSEQYGKPAQTRYEICGPRTIHLWPLTGRTHQLRVHMAHPLGLNNPILGDPLYGTAADHLHLTADRLSFTHPETGERMSFQKDFSD